MYSDRIWVLLKNLGLTSQQSSALTLVLEDGSDGRPLVENIASAIRAVGSLWNQDDVIAFSLQCGLSTGGD